MPARPSLHLDRERLRDALDRRLGVDARALAACRVLLGLTLLFDVFRRSRDLRTFYTDDGAYPRDLRFAESTWAAEYSLHALSGDAWFQAVLFAITAALAVALVVGYRPQLAALLAAGLVISLHWRNPHVLNAGDRLLRDLLLLAVFLPLAERWALRSRRTRRVLVATPATAATLGYVVLILFSNGLEKRRGDTWPTGEALEYALRMDHMTILLGNRLAEYPLLLELGTYGWYGLLLSSPLLLLTTGWARSVHALAFLGAVIGLGMSVAVGLFPPLLAAATVLFLPATFWDAAARVTGALRELAVATVSRLIAVDRARAYVAVPFERLPRPPRIPGTRTRPRRHVPIRRIRTPTARRRAQQCWSVVLGLVLIFVALWSAGMLGYADAFEPVDTLNPEDNTWGVYAPDPGQSYGWYVVAAELEDGEEVDVLQEDELRDTPPPDAAETVPGFRWRRYMTGALFADDFREDHREAFTRYACDRAVDRFDGGVESVTVTYTSREVGPDGEGEPTEFELVTRSCEGTG